MRAYRAKKWAKKKHLNTVAAQVCSQTVLNSQAKEMNIQGSRHYAQSKESGYCRRYQKGHGQSCRQTCNKTYQAHSFG
jgi:hypothetical protein